MLYVCFHYLCYYRICLFPLCPVYLSRFCFSAASRLFVFLKTLICDDRKISLLYVWFVISVFVNNDGKEGKKLSLGFFVYLIFLLLMLVWFSMFLLGNSTGCFTFFLREINFYRHYYTRKQTDYIFTKFCTNYSFFLHNQ